MLEHPGIPHYSSSSFDDGSDNVTGGDNQQET
jgi:hypothetical protein